MHEWPACHCSSVVRIISCTASSAGKSQPPSLPPTRKRHHLHTSYTSLRTPLHHLCISGWHHTNQCLSMSTWIRLRTYIPTNPHRVHLRTADQIQPTASPAQGTPPCQCHCGGPRPPADCGSVATRCPSRATWASPPSRSSTSAPSPCTPALCRRAHRPHRALPQRRGLRPRTGALPPRGHHGHPLPRAHDPDVPPDRRGLQEAPSVWRSMRGAAERISTRIFRRGPMSHAGGHGKAVSATAHGSGRRVAPAPHVCLTPRLGWACARLGAGVRDYAVGLHGRAAGGCTLAAAKQSGCTPLHCNIVP